MALRNMLSAVRNRWSTPPNAEKSTTGIHVTTGGTQDTEADAILEELQNQVASLHEQFSQMIEQLASERERTDQWHREVSARIDRLETQAEEETRRSQGRDEQERLARRERLEQRLGPEHPVVELPLEPQAGSMQRLRRLIVDDR